MRCGCVILNLPGLKIMLLADEVDSQLAQSIDSYLRIHWNNTLLNRRTL